MAQDQPSKEALFNEVKGSLFEYLLARKIAVSSGDEVAFVESLDRNYLQVLSQQDRMVRQFYPEMTPFLLSMAEASYLELIRHLGEVPWKPRITGKLINSASGESLQETDLILETSGGQVRVSLKLNKKNAFVNTKSGGIKSFFTTYFSFLPAQVQHAFNQEVDVEFARMAHELHALNDLLFDGTFHTWIRAGKSELPGELALEERQVLRSFYARVASSMHRILFGAREQDPKAFAGAILPLMGFSSPDIIQLVCFHDFKAQGSPDVQIHIAEDIVAHFSELQLRPFGDIASTEIIAGPWALQIRVKPMNKFTTTAIKINCSVKLRPSSSENSAGGEF